MKMKMKMKMKMEMFINSTPSPIVDDIASSIILNTFSSLIFVAVCVILSLYYCKRIGRALVETKIGGVIFFLGALLTVLVSLKSYVHEEIYGIHKLFIASFVGVVFLFVGTVTLFKNPRHYGLDRDGDGRPLISVGHTHGSMGIVIWVIALPLCAVEMFFAIGATTRKCSTDPYDAPIYAGLTFVALAQKLIQASVYHFSLRHKIPRPTMRMGCSWFLKTLSLFNFAFWVDSIESSHKDNAFVMKLFGNGFSIVKTAYNTLIIDYRLLCSLLFLEHALEIEEAREARPENLHDQIEEVSQEATEQERPVDVHVIHYSGYGYVIGLICISLQLVNGLQYLHFVGNWSSIFPILSNIVIIIAGLFLVNGATTVEDNNIRWRETESKAIDVMIGFMGAVGFVYRIIKSSFCIIWSFQPSIKQYQSYLLWNSSKEIARAISIVFQLYLFVKVGPHFCQEPRNRGRRVCHLIVPAIMLALFSTFLSCIIDQYNGEVEHLIHHGILDPALIAFFEAAAPIHLGFSLHMFLHFYIIKRKMSSLEYVHPRRRVRFTSVTEPNPVGDEDRSLIEPLLSAIENR